MRTPGVGNPSPPKRLEELAARALVGVDRAGGGKDGAAALLREASVVGAMARAGRAAGKAGAVPETCPAETREAAPGAMLATLLRQPEAALIEEWAELADARRLRVPEALVPGVLEWWAAQPRRSEVVFRVLGQRGDWLASLNPSWKKPVAREEIPANASEVWETATTAERVAVLRSVRRAEPARALTMLQATWKTDGAAERAKFVEALEEGLSLADEAFLETCLDDRSKQVRGAAAQLLSQLPQCAFASRMLARSVAMLAVETTGKGKKAQRGLTVTPPQEFDASWEQDGIEENAPSGTGKRAWWLRQVLERTPVVRLGQALDLDAAQCIAAASECEYAKDVISSLSVAAAANGDTAWREAMIRCRLAEPKVPIHEVHLLWAALSPNEQHGLAMDLLRSASRPPADLWRLAASIDGTWSDAMSREVCSALAALPLKKKLDWYEIGDVLDVLSRQVHPGVIDAFEAAVRAACGDDLAPSMQKSLDRLRLRAQMHKEFAS